jgi:hypothetical protein
VKGLTAQNIVAEHLCSNRMAGDPVSDTVTQLSQNVDLTPGWRWRVIGSCGSSAAQHTAPWCPASATCQVHGDGDMLRWGIDHGAHQRPDLCRCLAQLVVGALTAQLMTPAVAEAGAAATELRFLRLPEPGAQSTAECDPLASSGACVHSGLFTTKTCTHCRLFGVC